MQETEKGSFFEAIPLLAIPVIGVGAASYFMTGAGFETWLTSHAFDVPLSGNSFTIDGRFLFLIISTLILMWEILRSAYNHTISMQNHAFSVIIFLGSAFAFTQLQFLQSQLFLFVVVLTFIDVFAGFYITAKTRSRKTTARTEVVNIRADIEPNRG
ncbi:hypothetical protein V0U79_12115 [Hyphobacterium sp. HN65]|uniref:Uncharacterized protein n=1 Tax=Hyphobacterium lacteum TaxID=3116575 RepID=A0ABU7LTB4_9PROT|nr:hypothetical protein [Hyphobacterium sp. HN65]MEE2527115.1 hypothetical protein [Hyphobacterium sp. HN65]